MVKVNLIDIVDEAFKGSNVKLVHDSILASNPNYLTMKSTEGCIFLWTKNWEYISTPLTVETGFTRADTNFYFKKHMEKKAKEKTLKMKIK